MVATGINKRACHFDVASGPFKWPGGALMWPHGTLKNRKEFIKPTDWMY